MYFPVLLLLAHDFWIEPSTFHPAPGALVALRLRVGQDLLGDPVGRDPALVRQFIADDGVRRVDVPGRAGADPAGLFRAGGPAVVAYVSHPSPVELDAAKFHTYLKEEGLEAVIAQRERRGQAGQPGRERFARCAKSVLGPLAEDRALGLPLELVADKTPGSLRLLYEGKPLAGVLVVAMHRRDPARKQQMRSGADGRVRFRFDEPGLWLVKAVHMTPAPAGTGADWQSHWASLTFENGGQKP